MFTTATWSSWTTSWPLTRHSGLATPRVQVGRLVSLFDTMTQPVSANTKNISVQIAPLAICMNFFPWSVCTSVHSYFCLRVICLLARLFMCLYLVLPFKWLSLCLSVLSAHMPVSVRMSIHYRPVIYLWTACLSIRKVFLSLSLLSLCRSLFDCVEWTKQQTDWLS